MFKKLEVEINPNKIYEFEYNKEKQIQYIELLLINNDNIITIFKNEDESYSIYNKKDIDDDFIVDPIITFFENDNLRKVYRILDIYIKNQILLNDTISKFENRIEKLNIKNRNDYDYFTNKIQNINNLVFSDKKESKKLYGIIRKIIEDSNDYYEYADNFRFAKVGDKYQEYLYKETQDSGCCGFYDRVIDVDGIQYNIGFNYGH